MFDVFEALNLLKVETSISKSATAPTAAATATDGSQPNSGPGSNSNSNSNSNSSKPHLKISHDSVLSLPDAQMLLQQCCVARTHLDEEQLTDDNDNDNDNDDTNPDHANGNGNTNTGKMLRQRRAELMRKQAENRPLNRAMFIELLCRVSLMLSRLSSGSDANNNNNPKTSADPSSSQSSSYNPTTPSLALSFAKFADSRLLSKIVQPPLLPFPKQFMWEPEVASLFFKHNTQMRAAFGKYAKSCNFMQFAQTLRLCDKGFTSKGVRSVFCLSKAAVAAGKKRRRREFSFEAVCWEGGR